MSDQRRVLVTGGAGYIGSHTAKALALAGHAPVVFDDPTAIARRSAGGRSWWATSATGTPSRPACASTASTA